MGKPIELEIIWGDEQTATFDKVGMDYKLCDCPTKKVTYYNISAISPYVDEADNNKEYCRIHCNDSDFICVHDYTTTKNLINLAYKPTKKSKQWQSKKFKSVQ